MPSQWFQLQWPDSLAEVDIAVKQLVPIVVAAAIWGRLWYHSHVCFHSDNMAVVSILHSQSARGGIALHLLHCFYFYTAFFQFDYSTKHVPGVLNTAADAISGNHMALFSSPVPQATQSCVPIPLLDLLINLQPHWGSTRWTSLFVTTLHTL